MKKPLVIIVGVALIGGFLYFRSDERPAYVVSEHISFVGDHRINRDTILKNNAVIDVSGTLYVDERLSCEDGDILLRAEKVVVSGSLECQRSASAKPPIQSGGMTIVARAGVVFKKSAVVAVANHIQIVSSDDRILSQEKIEVAYNEIVIESAGGSRLGPFVDRARTLSHTGVSKKVSVQKGSLFIPRAYAQEVLAPLGKVHDSVISGTWSINDELASVSSGPKNSSNVLAYFDLGPEGSANFKNFHFVGSNGLEGGSDEGVSCEAKGERGGDAFRMRVRARLITLDDVTLELGDGGRGGSAVTRDDCGFAYAEGGEGGSSGNFKFTAQEEISIISFQINPGRGGEGGAAQAVGNKGAEGCPAGRGGDAEAVGGAGGMNKRELSATGALSGLSNILVSTVYGGNGGTAVARAGTGGDGNTCGCASGSGGKASTAGGKGGAASLNVGGVIGNAVEGMNGSATGEDGTNGVTKQCPSL